MNGVHRIADLGGNVYMWYVLEMAQDCIYLLLITVMDESRTPKIAKSNHRCAQAGDTRIVFPRNHAFQNLTFAIRPRCPPSSFLSSSGNHKIQP